MNNTLSKGKEIKIPGPDHPITISPAEGKVRVTVAGRIVAESTRALRLEEKGGSALCHARFDISACSLASDNVLIYHSLLGGQARIRFFGTCPRSRFLRPGGWDL